MRKKTDIKIRCNDIEQQLKEWGKVPTNSEDTNLLHKVNNLYRELGDKPEVQRLMGSPEKVCGLSIQSC